MVTVYRGPETGYTGAYTIVRQLEPHLMLTDPEDYPLLKAVGLDSYPDPITNVKVEWQVKKLTPMQDALNGAISATGTTDFIVDNSEYFEPYDVLMVDTELVRVMAINDTTETLVVERGFAGSTAATHSDNAVVYKVGRALPEGSAPGAARQLAVYQPYNYTQIFDAVAEVTGTQEALKYYAPDDLLADRLDDRLAELWQSMERSFIYGVRYQGSTNVGRSAGGLAAFIHDEDAQSGAPLSEAALLTALENVFQRAGLAHMPSAMWSNSWAKRKISSWYTGYAQMSRSERVGGIVIDSIETDFGRLSFNLDHLIKGSDLFLLNMDYLYAGSLNGRALAQMDSSVAGVDAKSVRALGEYTWIVQGEDGTNDGVHVHISGFSTSA